MLSIQVASGKYLRYTVKKVFKKIYFDALNPGLSWRPHLWLIAKLHIQLERLHTQEREKVTFFFRRGDDEFKALWILIHFENILVKS